jgi:hypothetical protein
MIRPRQIGNLVGKSTHWLLNGILALAGLVARLTRRGGEAVSVGMSGNVAKSLCEGLCVAVFAARAALEAATDGMLGRFGPFDLFDCRLLVGRSWPVHILAPKCL